MKICFLASASSAHTIRWANTFVDKGYEIHIITMHPNLNQSLDLRIKVYNLKLNNTFGYYLNYKEVNRLINLIQPDVLHVHYASGYGTLGRLTKYHPTLLSVWGSDVYIYPHKNIINKKILTKNLKSADQIASTSFDMKKKIEDFFVPKKEIEITPFGIDTTLFYKFPEILKEDIIIGTVKSLEYVYGIDILLSVFKKTLDLLEEQVEKELLEKVKLLIVGKGSEEKYLKALSDSLGLSSKVIFQEAVPNAEVPKFLNEIDIFCALSRSESFGVSVLEASACELPVIVSDVGGLPEVVVNNKSGYIVENTNIIKIASQIIELIKNEELRHRMGKEGQNML
ncbi:glycosyltransferase [Planococcus koreensis]|uniref:glycosyltransferase n=1 Tax=Planococcus koreensis TaxID=112331 RepID=UPI0039FD8B93